MAVPSVITVAACVCILTVWTAVVTWFYTRQSRTPQEDQPKQ